MDAKTVKPFPWMCGDCREKTVVPTLRDYSLSAVHDGATYDLTVRNIFVPTCPKCGQAVITTDISQRVSAELRHAVGLLTPESIRAKREALGLTHGQLATALRVGEGSLLRWESGMQLQSRAVDLLLRLYFDSADVRQACVTVPSAATAGASFSTAP